MAVWSHAAWETEEEMDLESLLLDLLELSITRARTARGSKDTSDFKHFKTLIKSLKVLLPFYFLLSQPLFFPFPLLLLLLSLHDDSAHFRHQTRLKQIRAKQMSGGSQRKLWQDNEVDCKGGTRDGICTGQKKQTARFTCSWKERKGTGRMCSEDQQYIYKWRDAKWKKKQKQKHTDGSFWRFAPPGNHAGGSQPLQKVGDSVTAPSILSSWKPASWPSDPSSRPHVWICHQNPPLLPSHRKKNILQLSESAAETLSRVFVASWLITTGKFCSQSRAQASAMC